MWGANFSWLCPWILFLQLVLCFLLTTNFTSPSNIWRHSSYHSSLPSGYITFSCSHSSGDTCVLGLAVHHKLSAPMSVKQLSVFHPRNIFSCSRSQSCEWNKDDPMDCIEIVKLKETSWPWEKNLCSFKQMVLQLPPSFNYSRKTIRNPSSFMHILWHWQLGSEEACSRTHRNSGQSHICSPDLFISSSDLFPPCHIMTLKFANWLLHPLGHQTLITNHFQVT